MGKIFRSVSEEEEDEIERISRWLPEVVPRREGKEVLRTYGKWELSGWEKQNPYLFTYQLFVTYGYGVPVERVGWKDGTEYRRGGQFDILKGREKFLPSSIK